MNPVAIKIISTKGKEKVEKDVQESDNEVKRYAVILPVDLDDHLESVNPKLVKSKHFRKIVQIYPEAYEQGYIKFLLDEQQKEMMIQCCTNDMVKNVLGETFDNNNDYQKNLNKIYNSLKKHGLFTRDNSKIKMGSKIKDTKVRNEKLTWLVPYDAENQNVGITLNKKRRKMAEDKRDILVKKTIQKKMKLQPSKKDLSEDNQKNEEGQVNPRITSKLNWSEFPNLYK